MSGRAVLWRKRHRGRKVIARAVLVALVGVVIFFGTVPYGGIALATNKNNEAKMGVVRSSEDVFVSDRTPGMKTLRSPSDFTEFAYGEVPSHYSGMEALLPGPDCRLAGKRSDHIIYDRIIESFRDSRVGDANKRDNSDFVSRSEAIISKDRSKFELRPVFSALAIVLPGFYRDIGPQLHRRGIAKMLELPFTGPPELIGSEPKTDCRDAEYDSEPGNYGLVVVVSLDPFKPSLAQKKSSSEEGGAVILIIVVVGLFTVLALSGKVTNSARRTSSLRVGRIELRKEHIARSRAAPFMPPP